MIYTKKAYKNLSDSNLIVLIQKKDISAFDELYARYSQRLLSFFYRMLGGDVQKAQDFLQEIFLKIAEKPHLIDPEKTFSAWIFTVARNMIKNEYRNQNTRDIFDRNVDTDNLSASRTLDSNPAERKVDDAFFQEALMIELSKLTEEQRATFLLRYQEHFSTKEISEILSCSQGTVKSRLFYATKKLAQRLQEFNPGNEQE